MSLRLHRHSTEGSAAPPPEQAEVTLQLLVVEDERDLCDAIAFSLESAGHRVLKARDGDEALRLLETNAFDLAICDVNLPRVHGLALFRQIRMHWPSTAVILMTAFGNVGDAVTAVREGAYDYVLKPFDLDDLTDRLVGRVAQERKLRKDLEDARTTLVKHANESVTPMIGRTPQMLSLTQRLKTIAQSEAPVLISGESGTGKELVARAIHERSSRSQGPFVAVNCAAFPEALLEAELFGHERGAFTGAHKKRDGRFKAADGGTLLLDEIADLPTAAQAKLLRTLQEGTIEPLGTNRSIHVDVRVVSATHKPLKPLIARGLFREDLYYRLNVLDLSIPPLRERKADLPLLFEHFLRRVTPSGHAAPSISPRAWAALVEYGFPGNVREFAHAIERAVVLARGNEIDLEHLPEDIAATLPEHVTPASPTFRPLSTAIAEFEREYLVRALNATNGHRVKTAEMLGISRKNLWEKLRQHGLSDSDFGSN